VKPPGICEKCPEKFIPRLDRSGCDRARIACKPNEIIFYNDDKDDLFCLPCDGL